MKVEELWRKQIHLAQKVFWGAKVYERNGTFYMYYTAEEHLAIATSLSPLGAILFKKKISQYILNVR